MITKLLIMVSDFPKPMYRQHEGPGRTVRGDVSYRETVQKALPGGAVCRFHGGANPHVASKLPFGLRS